MWSPFHGRLYDPPLPSMHLSISTVRNINKWSKRGHSPLCSYVLPYTKPSTCKNYNQGTCDSAGVNAAADKENGGGVGAGFGGAVSDENGW